MVIGQLLTDLVILGPAVKVIVGAAPRGEQCKASPGSTRAGGEER
ncbi:hypothetical protein OG535_38390 [Kitasatospora sp. NBC_00085]